ncbi:AAA family ATPase [Burkholderia vietnamiensis]|uniref:AAA family ATPase n=1 Tax=Burkholderia vietnamiensis TaxID=60552 RepID=UPI0009BD36C0|nr:AAA family ATPase [Burkholderia vietnamiensis]
MRLDKVYIDGFKNLKNLDVDFDEQKLTTVLIGQNGTGKSNLIEAITQIFQSVDLNRNKPRFQYRITYRIKSTSSATGQTARVTLSNITGEPAYCVDGTPLKQSEFDNRKDDLFPDLVFGYYSGGSRRLESLFDNHQRRYYDAIKREKNPEKVAAAQTARRMFYCRPIHGVLALMSLFSFPDKKLTEELGTKLGITGFHSLLGLFREPWFAKAMKPAQRTPENFWGATGPAGRTAHLFKTVAYHPLALEGNAIDDYRDKQQTESQYATFLPSLDHLKHLASNFASEREMFYALEAMDISDLIREMLVWVTRTNDASGDVSFADLSDGERQLLMVLGLIRVSRGKRALFLLDEPDTHLNPHWQHSYLRLIEDWTGIAADVDKCHIILTSHNPLTIAALSRDEVRVIYSDSISKALVAEQPFVDPRGLGVSGVLTDIFGLTSTLDIPTQELIDTRNKLARIEELNEAQTVALDTINEQLRVLGFMYEERDQLYRDFLKTVDDVELAERRPRTPDELKKRDQVTREVVEQLLRKQ